MLLRKLPWELTVCKAASMEDIRLDADFFFIGRTEEELSLVCRTSDVPARTTEREDGWRGFRVEGPLPFSMVGVLAGLSGVLAENGISIFALSTYQTDYLLVKEADFDRAAAALAGAGYGIARAEDCPEGRRV